MARGSKSRVVGRVRSVLIVGTVLVAGMSGTARAESKTVPVDDAYYVSNGDWYDEHLYAGHIPGRDNILAATVLRFGVGGAIPPGAEIESATLRMHNVAGNGELGAYRIIGTLPGTYDASFHDHLAGPVDVIPIAANGGWHSWDVTAIVRAWLAGTHPNDGIAIFDYHGWGAFDDAWAGANAPYLEIQYSSPNADPPQLWGRAPQAGVIRYDDVSGDGAADAVLRTNSGSVMVAYSQDYAYASFSLWGTWNTAWQVALADVDGDGSADLVGVDPASRAIMVAPSTDTSFGTATGWGTWPSGYDAQFADVDGDGLADVVGTSSTGDVRVAASTGTAFAPAASWGSTAAGDDVRFADVDGDEVADLVGYRPSDGVIRVAASHMEGFHPAEAWGTVGAGQRRFADADGDGNGDLWIRNPSTGDVLVRRSNAEGFTAASYWGNWDPGRDFDAADADGDTRADAVGWNPSTRDIFVGLTTVEIPDGPPVEAYSEDPEVDYDDEDIVEPDGFARMAPASNRVPRLAFQDGVLSNAAALDAGHTQRYYDRIDQAGGTVVRFNVIWGQTEDRDGNFVWNLRPPGTWELDRAVDEARNRGFHVHLTLTGVNATWDCASHILPTGLGCPPNAPTGADPDPDQFAQFVRAVVEHFTQPTVRVKSYSLWNEPNARGFLGRRGTANRLMPTALYRELYLKGYDAATDVYPDARVFIGELAEGHARAARLPADSHLGSKLTNVTAMDFLHEVARPRDGSNESIVTNGLAHHPYQHNRPPHRAGDRFQVGVGKLNAPLKDPRNAKRYPRTLTGIHKTMDLLFKRRGLSGEIGGSGVRWMRTPGSRRPLLYLTEFGYFNKPYKQEHLERTRRRYPHNKAYWHTEARREAWLRGRDDRPGALEVVRDSRAKWMLLYHLVEFPDRDAQGNILTDQSETWDTGLVGPVVGSGPAQVTGTRPYGKDPSGRNVRSLAFPQEREAYCAIWRWASSRPGEFGVVPFPGWYPTESNECGTVVPDE